MTRQIRHGRPSAVGLDAAYTPAPSRAIRPMAALVIKRRLISRGLPLARSYQSRTRHVSAGPVSGLLASAFWPAGEQRDAFNPDFSGAVHIRCGDGVQGFALRSADGQTHKVARCRNSAKMFGIFVEDLYTVGR